MMVSPSVNSIPIIVAQKKFLEDRIVKEILASHVAILGLPITVRFFPETVT
jgi:hypothetical protein